jgi:hypothetical protein
MTFDSATTHQLLGVAQESLAAAAAQTNATMATASGHSARLATFQVAYGTFAARAAQAQLIMDAAASRTSDNASVVVAVPRLYPVVFELADSANDIARLINSFDPADWATATARWLEISCAANPPPPSFTLVIERSQQNQWLWDSRTNEVITLPTSVLEQSPLMIRAARICTSLAGCCGDTLALRLVLCQQLSLSPTVASAIATWAESIAQGSDADGVTWAAQLQPYNAKLDVIIFANALGMPKLLNAACMSVANTIKGAVCSLGLEGRRYELCTHLPPCALRWAGMTNDQILSVMKSIPSEFTPEEQAAVLQENAWAFQPGAA